MPFDGTHYITEDHIRSILRQGRARVERGWCQNHYEQHRRWYEFGKPKASYCLLGAINEDEDAIIPLLHAIGLPFGDFEDLWEWNDAPERTKEEVLAVFDAALK